MELGRAAMAGGAGNRHEIWLCAAVSLTGSTDPPLTPEPALASDVLLSRGSCVMLQGSAQQSCLFSHISVDEKRCEQSLKVAREGRQMHGRDEGDPSPC